MMPLRTHTTVKTVCAGMLLASLTAPSAFAGGSGLVGGAVDAGKAAGKALDNLDLNIGKIVNPPKGLVRRKTLNGTLNLGNKDGYFLPPPPGRTAKALGNAGKKVGDDVGEGLGNAARKVDANDLPDVPPNLARRVGDDLDNAPLEGRRLNPDEPRVYVVEGDPSDWIVPPSGVPLRADKPGFWKKHGVTVGTASLLTVGFTGVAVSQFTPKDAQEEAKDKAKQGVVDAGQTVADAGQAAGEGIKDATGEVIDWGKGAKDTVEGWFQ